MSVRTTLLGLTAAIAVTLTAGIADAASKKVIRYAHFQAADLSSPKQAAALAFKNYVESNTDGEIEVQVFPASQLGDGSVVMQGLQLGTIQMGVVHDGPISSVYKPFGVFALPYLFDDQAMAWDIVDGPFLDAMSKDMEAKTGIKLFALADNGVRNFTNSKRPITSPEDMKGLKMRVMTAPIWVKLTESLGASATPVPWPELPGALQAGVVDGQENGVTNILNAGLYQFQKYVSLDGHVFSWHAYMMNAAFFNDLTPDQQKVIERGIALAKIIHRGMTAAQDANAAKILGDKGMEVTPISAEQKAEFRKLAQPAVRAWLVDQIGEEWIAKLEAEVAAYRAR